MSQSEQEPETGKIKTSVLLYTPIHLSICPNTIHLCLLEAIQPANHQIDDALFSCEEWVSVQWVQKLSYIDGAAHEGTPLQGLFHDLEELLWGFLHFIEFGHSSSEVLHGLCGVASFESLIGAMQPGEGDGMSF